MAEQFFTADTHFGHEFFAYRRGFRTEQEHDQALIDAWNTDVGKGDVVYHLGDFMLPQDTKRAEEILSQLNGTKLLIRGNHERIQTERAEGWAWIGDYKKKRIGNVSVVMFHYAMRTWQGCGNGSFHLYGHSHGNLAPWWGRSMDVGVDTSGDYGPWPWEEIYDRLAHFDPKIVDHHVSA